MYRVEWTAAAREDLLTRVETGRVANALVQVAATCLDAERSADGDFVPPLYWRRGLCPECRAKLDGITQLDSLDEIEQPWHYLIIYKGLGQRGPGYQVIGIRHQDDFGQGFLQKELW